MHPTFIHSLGLRVPKAAVRSRAGERQELAGGCAMRPATGIDPMRTSANVGYGDAECCRAITEPTSRAINSAQARHGSLMFSTSPSG
jgi:hypothetical protein